jgi:sugar phosphate isomerase/epimerase
MKGPLNRRGFLQSTAALGAGVGLASLGGGRLLAAGLAGGASNAEKLGWRLGCQAWSFHTFTFYEAVDKTASLGLRYIEAYPNQKLSPDQPNEVIGEGSPPHVRKAIKQKLSDAGVKLINLGVCLPFKDAGQARKTFDFAKEMGIETIVWEPLEETFNILDKLCEEYGINVAIHNHANPSPYWNPDTILKVCKGRSKRIGACADTGHWMRSGLNPIECLKKLEGRIVSLHFKDLDQPGPEAHDVPWGTGVCDVKGMFGEIRRQGIKPVFSIEYEYNWENSLPEIAQCVTYFDKVAASGRD